ncbi:MAG: hypothetical protein OEZ39_07075 [Gammaproteobacteria bacterium]|nr:hypothetical protein [Gammaproteobacteria bacterium]MDH5651619.1 hypothetical protein [Gammaproteobacteria bacterium]
MNDTENDFEELVLKESIVSASGLNSNSLLVGIRGDPSLRETTFDRKRYKSEVDENIDTLMPILQELMLNRSTYKLFIGFNNGEIRTTSIFDPLREEVHSVSKMIDHSYIERQFPEVTYEEKIQLMRDIYNHLRNNPIYQRLPTYWRNIMARRSAAWEPMEQDEVMNVLSTLKTLREMPTYYIRNITISIVQSIVRMQFNCDGTQIVSAENYKRFLEDNLSAE